MMRLVLNSLGNTVIPPPPPPPDEGEGLTEGGNVVFLDTTGGDDTWDGLYGDDQGDASGGPLKTFAAVNALDLSNVVGIYLLEGTTSTGTGFWNQTDFTGTAEEPAVLGAYYMNAGTPTRGLNAGNRPIIQGTAARIFDYDGTNQLSNSQMVPSWTDRSPSASFPAGQGLVGADFDVPTDAYIRIENLYIRHSGGRGIRYTFADHLQVFNCYVQLCLDSGIQLRDCAGDIQITDSYCSGCAGGEQWVSLISTRPSSISLRRCGEADSVKIQRNVVWQQWGEAINCWFDAPNVLMEDNVSIDSSIIHFYIDSTRDSVFRRNLAFQSGGSKSNGCSDLRDAPMFSHQIGEFDQFANDTEKLAICSQNNVFYGNIGIGCRQMHEFWDQDYSRGSGLTQGNYRDYYIFRNTSINAGQEYDSLGSTGHWTADNLRVWDNMHLQFDGRSHSIDANWAAKTSLANNNAWNNTPPSGFTNNITGDTWDGDETGFENLQSLTTWEADDHIDISDIDDYITAVKAKLGGPTGGSVGSGSAGVHPSGITVASFVDLDFDITPYVTNDVGAKKG